ncbi:MAG: RIO1 family regulatory kinase/ATPase [Gammaproteobacteria bacterium]|jgi:predicted Ser/Thr protein kinase|nr:RIO1 family regulatory kinase/ATPase [Gammaproteobacteria bacterium]MDP6616677.1 RIO1 family regulatory kinase/ATPase [Gammaproteobacteria bacterium]MDP6696116.1 RIO1 family regulatory kinase/ATPase [Gammaproteobacteria bacterium]MDP7042063.1 RIO1 family regulatory kinase/ATPase [Gammaproteobacteria bacterium]
MDTQLQQELRAWLSNEKSREAALLSTGYQGSAYLYDHGGRRLVIKKASSGFFTGWIHRRMLQREARVYELLAEVEGVPHSPGMLDDTWLVLEYIEGRTLKVQRSFIREPEVFYNRLHKVIKDFHTAGVAHGDLKRKENVLVAEGEQPFVIDFGMAAMRDGGLIDRLLFRFVRRVDYNAWVKLKYHRNYSAVSDEDQQWYRPTIIERTLRVIRRAWRKVTFRQARKRRRQS